MNNVIKKGTIEAYKKLDSCTISDAFDDLKMEQGGYIQPKLMTSRTKICGQAYTVRYLPKHENSKGFGSFLDDVPKDRVIVIDNEGRIDGSVWGDTMALYAQRKGISGTVINGVYRDVGIIQDLQYPVFAKGNSIRSGKTLVSVDAVEVPIQIDNVVIKPNDLIFGDESGIIVIPFEYIDQVLEKAETLKKQDDVLVKNIHAGLSYKEAKNKQ